MTQPTCAVADCDRQRMYRLYCHGHYRRWKRTGDPGPAEIRSCNTEPPICRFEGCGRPRRTNGLCGGHYLQTFHGKPLTPLLVRPDTLARDDQGRKQCRICAAWLPVAKFYRNALTKDGLATQCVRCHRGGNLRRAYALTLDEYDKMLADQGGVCAICGGVNGSGRKLYVDHDHATSAVRGLLCITCNRGIGNFRDSVAHLRAAIAYLESPPR